MNNFETLKEIILSRRSGKTASMNGKKIDNAQIDQLLELADWAPTHARTEPWRFIVYSGESLKKFDADHAELYKEVTAEDKFMSAKYDKLLHNGDLCSHVIAVIMKRNPEHKIPAVEEVCAVSCAVENILLGAETLDIAALWSTGGLVHNPAMKKYFELGEEDSVLGLLFLGYTDEEKKARQKIDTNGSKSDVEISA